MSTKNLIKLLYKWNLYSLLSKFVIKKEIVHYLIFKVFFLSVKCNDLSLLLKNIIST
jgi:hypothetical protein